MKNSIFKLSLFLLLSIGFFSCETEPLDQGLEGIQGPTEESFFSVNINDQGFATNNASASIESGMLTINAQDSEGKFILKSQGVVVGTYTNSQLNFVYTDSETADVYSSIHPISGLSNSELTVTSVNFQAQTITGIFYFTGYKISGDTENPTIQEISFSQGVFSNVPYGNQDQEEPEVPGESSGDYLPLAVGNIWNYTNNGVFELGDLQVIDGIDFYRATNTFFMGNDLTFLWPGLEEYVGKQGSNYYVKVSSEANSPAPVEPFQIIILKDNLNQGESWTDTFSLPFVDEDGEIIFNVTINNVIKDKDISYTVNGVTYQNVIKVRSTNKADLIYNGIPIGDSEVSYTDMWFAKDVGIIKSISSDDDPEWEDEIHELIDYNLN